MTLQKEKLENQITNLFEGHINGNIPTDLFDKLSKKYTSLVNDISLKIKDLTKPKVNKEAKINYLLQATEFINNLKTYDDNFFNDEIVNSLIDKIIIGKEYLNTNAKKRVKYKVLVNIKFNITDELLDF